MITRPTTLILGAGASKAYGFPTGSELVQRVLEWSDVGMDEGKYYFYLHNKIDKEKLQAFRNALKYSGKMSIDAFLEYRPEFIDIGKIAIALALIDCETVNNVFDTKLPNWYQYLSSLLSSSFEDFSKNKLRILTFNYDRSLEFYLLRTIQSSYNKPIIDCVTALKSIPIIHLHGDLGNIPEFDGNQSREYNKGKGLPEINIAANRIKIIHEGIDNDPQFNEAHTILNKTDVLCFLGFGYHHKNMERLGFGSTHVKRAYPNIDTVHGTSHGLTDAECKNIDRHFGVNVSFNFERYDVQGMEILDYLRHTGILNS